MDLYFLVLLHFLLLQSVSGATECSGGYIAANGTYARNRDILLSSLSSNVTAEGGLYNASNGQDPDRVYAQTLCRRGYTPEDCSRCVSNQYQLLINQCLNRTEGYVWDGDNEILCFIRYSNRSFFGSMQDEPLSAGYNSGDINTNLTQFGEAWNTLLSKTIASASVSTSSSRIKYYAATEEKLTVFQNMYMLMMCTPDIAPQDCNRCLRLSTFSFGACCYGKLGGFLTRPSCYFRWDLYPFHGAFDNITTTANPPLAPPEVQTSPADKQTNQTTEKDDKNMSSGAVAAVVISVLIVVFVLIAFGRYVVHRRKKRCRTAEKEDDLLHTLRLDLRTVQAATNDFSPENQLGQGGFGVVYKGKLPNGREIAVKRLSMHSRQGDAEFKNEFLLLAGLQHRNLVNLLGFCLEGNEKLLIYEFLPNSSLDLFIFDPVKRSLLTWDIRYRIIVGIARGLLYLHEDSQPRIIHRDLKPGNVLLDTQMNPKISDFGMARLFTEEETHGVSNRVMGTFGYMPPEYVGRGNFSVKSDVYSFGVLVLEIISGEKTSSFQTGLPAYVWRCWTQETSVGMIDPVITSYSRHEVMRCIHIGLLCTQENVSRRPMMNSVVLWLSSGYSSYSLPAPTTPGFLIQSNIEEGTPSSNQAKADVGNFSVNEISLTELDPR